MMVFHSYGMNFQLPLLSDPLSLIGSDEDEIIDSIYEQLFSLEETGYSLNFDLVEYFGFQQLYLGNRLREIKSNLKHAPKDSQIILRRYFVEELSNWEFNLEDDGDEIYCYLIYKRGLKQLLETTENVNSSIYELMALSANRVKKMVSDSCGINDCLRETKKEIYFPLIFCNFCEGEVRSELYQFNLDSFFAMFVLNVCEIILEEKKNGRLY